MSLNIRDTYNIPALKPLDIPNLNIRNYHLADYQHEVIMESIKDFEDSLDNDHEVAIQLASFGQSILLNVTSIGFSNPSLIHFYGYVNGQFAELIQHVNQLSFLLLSTKKDEPTREPRRIGFISKSEDLSDFDNE
jgi:hypothetical protein